MRLAAVLRVSKQEQSKSGQSRYVLCCNGCGRAYGGRGWCDVLVPDAVWATICPEGGNGGGLLCFNCIADRCEDHGFDDVPFAVKSGPMRASPEDPLGYQFNGEIWTTGRRGERSQQEQSKSASVGRSTGMAMGLMASGSLLAFEVPYPADPGAGDALTKNIDLMAKRYGFELDWEFLDGRLCVQRLGSRADAGGGEDPLRSAGGGPPAADGADEDQPKPVCSDCLVTLRVVDIKEFTVTYRCPECSRMQVHQRRPFLNRQFEVVGYPDDDPVIAGLGDNDSWVGPDAGEGEKESITTEGAAGVAVPSCVRCSRTMRACRMTQRHDCYEIEYACDGCGSRYVNRYLPDDAPSLRDLWQVGDPAVMDALSLLMVGLGGTGAGVGRALIEESRSIGNAAIALCDALGVEQRGSAGDRLVRCVAAIKAREWISLSDDEIQQMIDSADVVPGGSVAGSRLERVAVEVVCAVVRSDLVSRMLSHVYQMDPALTDAEIAQRVDERVVDHAVKLARRLVARLDAEMSQSLRQRRTGEGKDGL